MSKSSWDKCECQSWARDGSAMLTDHHPKCSEYTLAYVEESCRAVIVDLLKGIEAGAADTDGIPGELWEPYKRAKAFVGQFDWKEEEK